MNRLNLLDHPVCLKPPLRLAHSAWIQHVPFAMYLIDVLRPRTVVELGTFYGVSYCGFCQAVKELGIETNCYGVDTWRGDPQGGFFGDELLNDLRQHHDPLYGDFSRLMQMTFDEAASHFEDGSIDLLHIDGFHTYEAVRHDFETWLPRMSPRGVILFHDIAEHMLDFGVWRLWDELKLRYPSYDVEFGHGLGLLAVGPEQPPELELLVGSTGVELERFRESFRRLGMFAERLNETELLRRGEERQKLDEQQRSTREAERAAQMRRDRPLVTRASYFFNVWAADGLGRALSLGAAKLRQPSRVPASQAAISVENVEQC